MKNKTGKVMLCEIVSCGKLATVGVRDILRRCCIHGKNWKEMEPWGEVHYFCNDHKRESLVI